MTDVYLLGYYKSGSNNVPCHWKNGQRSDHDHVTADISIYDMIVLDGTLYSVGYDNYPNKKICIWKDAEFHKLDEGGLAASICAGEPGYIYIGGADTADKKATCWKVRLSDFSIVKTIKAEFSAGMTDAIVKDLCFDGDKLYMACTENNGTVTKCFTLSYAGGAPSTTYLPAKKLAVIKARGGNIYVCGQDSGGNACYWVDGVPTVLSDNASEARDMAFKGGDVYVLGLDNDVPCYWVNDKDGLKTLGKVDDETTSPKAIALEGDDVYVSGVYFSDSISDYVVFYMKNGVVKFQEEVKSNTCGIATVSYTK